MQSHEVLDVIEDALRCTKSLDDTLAPSSRPCNIFSIQRMNDYIRGSCRLVISIVNKDGVAEDWELEASALNKVN